MIARLWAIQIRSGAKVFADVPNKLREQVAKLLVEDGFIDLVPVSFGGMLTEGDDE